MKLDKSIKIIKKEVNDYCKNNFSNDFNLKKPSIKLHEPTFGSEEINGAIDVLLSRNITMGEKVIKFENLFSKKFAYKKSISCNSGSSANLLAISALTNLNIQNRLEPGDEVLVSALSWSTTIWPLIQCGLIPVIIDINSNTLNLDENLIEKSISKKTKAIMPVHVYGNPCNMDEILRIKKKYDLLLIEDCCEAMGAKYKDKTIGSFGDVGTFSFYFSHHITTLEGGMCVTNNIDLSERMKILRAHGWLRDIDYPEKFNSFEIDKNFTFVDLGYNFRITELQGDFGIKQLAKFDRILKKRKKVFWGWKKIFDEYSDLFLIQQEQKNGESSFFGFAITLRENCPFKVNDIRKFFQINGIETRPIICGNIALQPAMKNYKHRIFGKLTNSSYVMNNSFSIGCHQNITVNAQNYLKIILKKFLNNYLK